MSLNAVSSIAFYEGNRWDAVVYKSDEPDTVVISRNGVALMQLESVDLAETRFIRWPFRGMLLAVAEHTGCSHGQTTTFFVIRNGQLHATGMEPNGELGGPTFRDLDRDGKPEIVFTDWGYLMRGPWRYVAYKLDNNGLPRHWRDLPNPKHEMLVYRWRF